MEEWLYDFAFLQTIQRNVAEQGWPIELEAVEAVLLALDWDEHKSLPELPAPVEVETCKCRRDHGRKMDIVTGEQWCSGCGRPITIKPGRE